jgi:hypothetical protein
MNHPQDADPRPPDDLVGCASRRCEAPSAQAQARNPARREGAARVPPAAGVATGHQRPIGPATTVVPTQPVTPNRLAAARTSRRSCRAAYAATATAGAGRAPRDGAARRARRAPSARVGCLAAPMPDAGDLFATVTPRLRQRAFAMMLGDAPESRRKSAAWPGATGASGECERRESAGLRYGNRSIATRLAPDAEAPSCKRCSLRRVSARGGTSSR